MPLPPEPTFANDSMEPLEDPLGYFPSENQKTHPTQARRAPAVHVPYQRWLEVLKIALLAVARRLAHVVTASRTYALSLVRRVRCLRFRAPTWRLPTGRLRAWRLPSWRLPAWRPPALQLPAWRLPAWRPSALQLPAWRLPARVPSWHLPAWHLPAWRGSITAAMAHARSVSLSAFACGVVVGAGVMWLSGSGRTARAEPTVSAPAAREAPGAPDAAVAPVTAGVATTPVPVVQAGTATAGSRAAAGPRQPLFRGSLVVNSRPSGARVFVNGRSVGETPLVLRNQPAGSRAIRVALDGYESWSTAVRVVADTETRLRAELKAQSVAGQP